MAKKKFKKRNPTARKKNQEPAPQKATSVTMMTLKIYLIHVASFCAFLLTALLFESTNYTDAISTVVSVFVYLSLCYIVALRSGNRDRKYEEYSKVRINGFNGLYAAAMSQAAGFLIAIILQFKTSDTLLDIYQFLYIPFSLAIQAIEKRTMLIYFLPLIFAPLMFGIAYLTGRSSLLPEKVPKFIQNAQTAKQSKKKKQPSTLRPVRNILIAGGEVEFEKK